MNRPLTIIGFPVAAPAGVVLADDDCFVPMADWQPRDTGARQAEGNGWMVRRIRIDDGWDKIDGRDAEGRRIEVTVHPATLEMIDYEYEAEDGRRDHDRDRFREGGAND